MSGLPGFMSVQTQEEAGRLSACTPTQGKANKGKNDTARVSRAGKSKRPGERSRAGPSKKRKQESRTTPPSSQKRKRLLLVSLVCLLNLGASPSSGAR